MSVRITYIDELMDKCPFAIKSEDIISDDGILPDINMTEI
jgi:hypothetical protein